jgi:hypothetical protein
MLRLPLRRLLAAAAALAAAAGAAAQTAAPPPADTVTVTGTRLSPEAVHQRAVDFVHATGVAAGEIPAARWAAPVCPHVIGITDPAAARLVEAKLRTVAADAGIAVAPAPCRGNIAIVFAADGGGVVRDIVARSPGRLASLAPAAVATLIDGAAPIRWWYSSDVRDKDGIAATATGAPSSTVGGAEGGGSVLPGTADTTFIQHYASSLVSTEDVRTLRAATVVVDVTRTDGLPLSAVASYAAMVALAEIRPGAAPPDSVLGLFAGGPVLRSPTAWDLAFLRALYRLPLDRAAMRQRGLLVADLVTGLTR